MNKTYTSEEIKYRLSDLGVQIGNIAIEYITELEKEIDELKNANVHDKSKKKKRWLLKRLQKKSVWLKMQRLNITGQ